MAATVDEALANININQGFLAFQTSTNGMGDPTKTVTVQSGAVLGFYSTTNPMDKVAVLNGGTICGESGAQNTFIGPITLTGAGGVFDAGGNLVGGTTVKPDAVLSLTGPITGVGGATKTGPGTVIIKGLPGYDGNTTINAGTLQINTAGSPVLHNVTGAGILGAGDGSAVTNLTVASINTDSLVVGAGSIVTIAPVAGGPLAGAGSLTAVPEPSTWAMLMLGAMGLGIYWRRSR